ncbi:MAG TPA: AAA family ATPase [Thermoanaerobaculia bacterium]|nr:AAA family ATPase [Thermoanaerobaculia bacterium]
MRLLELYLKAFGPFTERRLDLSGGEPGLHLVFGPNEAGKSSALRALRALLYGFPKQTGDDFLHSYDQLRVGGRLRLADGSELAFLRRKGQKSTLLAADDESPLDDGLLDRCLRGIDEKLFATLFGIDHDALLQGGQELLEQKGDVGQALFAAGLGTRNLRKVLGSLDEEADALFRPRGQVKAINLGLAEHQKTKRELAEHSLSGREWDGRRRELEKRRGESSELESRLAGWKTERNRLARLRRALPRLANRRGWLTRREALGEVVVLPAGFPERRREVQDALRSARERRSRAEMDLAGLRDEATGLEVPRDVLDRAETIEALHQGVRKFEEDQKSRNRLLAERGELRVRAEELLEDIRPGLTLDEAEALRPALERWQRIQELAQRRQELDAGRKQARRDLQQAERRLAATRDALASRPEPRDPSALRRRAETVRKAGDLDRALAEAGEALGRDEVQLRIELSRLGLWSGSAEELEALPVPPAETLERFRESFAALAERRRGLDDQGKALSTEQAGVEQDLDEIRRAGTVPTEDELHAARDRRNREWNLLLRAWLAGEEIPDGQADIYEKAVGEADDLADRLRREADRVQKQAHLLARQDQLVQALETLKTEEAAVAQQDDCLRDEWIALWSPCGFAPRTPKEMQAWAARHERLRARAEALRLQRHQVETLEKNRRSHHAALVRALKAVTEQAAASDLLEPLLTHAEETVRALEEAARERARLGEGLRDAEAELAAASDAESAAAADLEEWQEAWAEAVRGFGFDRQALPGEVAHFVGTLRDAFGSLQQAAGLDVRIAALDREIEAFKTAVGVLAEALAPDLAGQPADQIAVQLHARLAEARQRATRRRDLDQRIQKLDEEIRDAGTTGRAMEERLALLVREAGCDGEAGLEEAEARSAESQKIAAALEETERELLLDGEGLTLDDLEREAAGVDGDLLPAEIDRLGREVEELERRSLDLREELGKEQLELAHLTGGDAAARAAEREQEILATLRENVERYTRLRLAAAVLRREVDRYRAENQAPLLRRAGDLFTALTLGRYRGLQTDYDREDEPVLVGVREGGKKVRVEGMSSGTRDQLYLSLRLATLERYLAHAEPLPFIVDDILINFDDDRTAATLKVLADLAKKTQVILFTHHARLKELAGELRNGVGVFVRELP